MNGWDWRLNRNQDAINMRSQIKNNITLRMKEDKIKEEVAKRTLAEKRALKIRRIITMILSLVVIVAGWVAIVVLAIYTETITSYITEKVSSFLGNWTPTLIITAVNFIIPWLL